MKNIKTKVELANRTFKISAPNLMQYEAISKLKQKVEIDYSKLEKSPENEIDRILATGIDPYCETLAIYIAGKNLFRLKPYIWILKNYLKRNISGHDIMRFAMIFDSKITHAFMESERINSEYYKSGKDAIYSELIKFKKNI